MPKDTTSLGPCYAKITVQHRARAGVSSEELTANRQDKSHRRHQAHERAGNTAVLENIFSG